MTENHREPEVPEEEVPVEEFLDGLARISKHDAAEVYSPEEHRHAETNPTCVIHEGYCASH